MCNYCGKELKSGVVTCLKNYLIGDSGKDVGAMSKMNKKLKALMKNKGQERIIKKISIEKTCKNYGVWEKIQVTKREF